MNKVEKIALQCAKQDKRNFPELNFTIKKLKIAYVTGWKNRKWSLEEIRNFKIWNRQVLKFNSIVRKDEVI